MKGFLLSLQSEYYKSRNTLGFWSAILLPLILTFLVSVGFYLNYAKLMKLPSQILWAQFAGIAMGIMGSLLLPIFIIFLAYSVNNIEHKSDTWKTLFTLPIAKWSVYSAKYIYTLFLLLLSLMLFAALTIGFGNLLGVIQPKLNFSGCHMERELFQIYSKLFLASLGILSVQFVMSLLWKDFLKPMGIGFVATIVGVILVTAAHWEYAYAFPYSQPLLSIVGLTKKLKSDANLDFFTSEVGVSLAIAAVVYTAGYFIVQRKSVK